MVGDELHPKSSVGTVLDRTWCGLQSGDWEWGLHRGLISGLSNAHRRHESQLI